MDTHIKLKTGGIYKTVDSDSYIVIITIINYVYYYEVINCEETNISVSNQYVKDTLED